MKKSRALKFYPPPSISSDGMALLKSYAWPGNVRELENLLERELIATRSLSKGRPFIFESFDFPAIAEKTAGAVPEGVSDVPTMDEAVSRHIRRVLHLTGGRIFGTGGAAEILGMNPNTLRGRMRKLGIRFEKRTAIVPRDGGD